MYKDMKIFATGSPGEAAQSRFNGNAGKFIELKKMICAGNNLFLRKIISIMLVAGHYYTLKVNRISDYGLYLADEDGNEVLLPNRYVSVDYKPGISLEVFVYHDSEDRLVATTERPLATVGQTACLKVVDKTVHGAFLDWGLPAKDLFLPNRNQSSRLDIGKKYPVYLYTDNITGRVVATTYLKGFINNVELTVSPREEVDILIATETPIGFRVVINDRHWGMIYRNQIFQPVAVGDRMKAYIVRITDDNRVDLALQGQGYDEVKKSAERLLEILRKNGNALPVNDDSKPEKIRQLTQMSKKTFKRSAGYLMKQGKIAMDGQQIRLTESD